MEIDWRCTELGKHAVGTLYEQTKINAKNLFSSIKEAFVNLFANNGTFALAA